MPYIASFERIWKEEAFNEGIKKGEKIGEKRGVKKGEERGVKIGEERGVKIGEERGKRNAYLKTAIWMLSEGYSESVIKQLTGLSLKQINSLKNTPVDSQTND